MQDEGEDGVEAEVCALCCQECSTITSCGECKGHHHAKYIDTLVGIILFVGHMKWHALMLNSLILPDATCLVGKVCSPLWSTSGASLGEGKCAVKVGIVNTTTVC